MRIKVRQPLSRATVRVPKSAWNSDFDALKQVLADEINVKEVVLIDEKKKLWQLIGKPNFKELGKDFGKDTPQVAEHVRSLDDFELSSLDNGDPLTVTIAGQERVLHKRHVDPQLQVTTGGTVSLDGPFAIVIDQTLTPALESEGLARELVSRVQRLRRDAGFAVTDRIALVVRGAAPVLEAARNHQAFIIEETLARRFEPGGTLDKPELEQQLDLDGHSVTVGLARLGAGA
ncbi:MAG: DUF5915 domain-containing protein [Gemmatimonadota bacterium]